MRVHAIQTGRLATKSEVFRGRNRLAIPMALFRRRWFEFPVHAYVIAHDDGHIVVDTGASHTMPTFPGVFRKFIEPNDEIGPQMRAKGLRAEDVRLVVPTHLDVDHAGGIGHFPNAEIIVHRPEYDYASTFMGKQRYAARAWPTWFKPKLYDLRSEPYGAFPQSRSITDRGDVTLVPIPGHSIAQVAVVAKTDGPLLFFAGDHMIRQDWFAEDVAAGRFSQALHFNSPKTAAETSKRIRDFVREFPTVLVPAHDDEAESRLTSLEPLNF
jgi:glyoxylase-like metal-dependent hydrolase (beta-lactamase superfamily II)